jgi:predicted transcriptional regulator
MVQHRVSGESSLHPTVAHKLIHRFQRSSEENIAKKLFISEPTVRTHVSNILRKLHLDNRTQAALYALREGFASLED